MAKFVWLSVVVAFLSVLAGCEEDQGRKLDVPIYTVCWGQDIRSSFGMPYTFAPKELGGRVFILVNGNPVASSNQGYNTSINRWLKRGTNKLTLIGSCEKPFKFLIHEQKRVAGGGDMLCSVEIPAREEFGTLWEGEITADIDYELAVYDKAEVIADSSEARQEIAQLLSEVNELLISKEAEQAHDLIFEVGQPIYYCKSVGDQTSFWKSERVSFEPLNTEKLRYFFGEKAVLVYLADKDDTAGVFRIVIDDPDFPDMPEREALLVDVCLIKIEGQWKFW